MMTLLDDAACLAVVWRFVGQLRLVQWNLMSEQMSMQPALPGSLRIGNRIRSVIDILVARLKHYQYADFGYSC